MSAGGREQRLFCTIVVDELSFKTLQSRPEFHPRTQITSSAAICKAQIRICERRQVQAAARVVIARRSRTARASARKGDSQAQILRSSRCLVLRARLV